MLDVERDPVVRASGSSASAAASATCRRRRTRAPTARAEDDPMRERSHGDENTFRLIPFAATATTGSRTSTTSTASRSCRTCAAGSSYYVWWMTAPERRPRRRSCNDGERDRGVRRGQGARRVARRRGLDRPRDPRRADRHAAARSMRESGIEHAGFYGECQLGEGRRLRLGHEAVGRRRDLVRRRRLRVLKAAELDARDKSGVWRLTSC